MYKAKEKVSHTSISSQLKLNQLYNCCVDPCWKTKSNKTSCFFGLNWFKLVLADLVSQPGQAGV